VPSNISHIEYRVSLSRLFSYATPTAVLAHGLGRYLTIRGIVK
jgi:hypothetical protein